MSRALISSEDLTENSITVPDGVWCQKSIATKSCRIPIVEVENAAEPLSSDEEAAVDWRWDDELVASPWGGGFARGDSIRHARR
jgi:hypothetical protein